nr:unnamed protein product [Callosobruchus analis]
MSEDEDLFMNGSTTRIKSIYQQASTGEKHVLFYPTSTPTPTSSTEERKIRQDDDTKVSEIFSILLTQQIPSSSSLQVGRVFGPRFW